MTKSRGPGTCTIERHRDGGSARRAGACYDEEKKKLAIVRTGEEEKKISRADSQLHSLCHDINALRDPGVGNRDKGCEDGGGDAHIYWVVLKGAESKKRKLSEKKKMKKKVKIDGAAGNQVRVFPSYGLFYSIMSHPVLLLSNTLPPLDPFTQRGGGCSGRRSCCPCLFWRRPGPPMWSTLRLLRRWSRKGSAR
jgi:hypothetical protein